MESLPIFAFLILIVICVAVVAVQFVRLLLGKHFSRKDWISSSLALLLVAIVVTISFTEAGIEYNPSNATLEQIAGYYGNGSTSLTLRIDGSYTSHNLKGLTSGTWNHHDWNLSFSGSTLKEARWITRNGKPAILPYYSGPDGSDGLLLKKHSEQVGAADREERGR